MRSHPKPKLVGRATSNPALSGRIRVSIIGAVAALSVLSLGPMTSLASARPVVKIGKIQIDCPVEDKNGALTWYPEGTTRDREVEAADGTVFYVHEVCANGEWISAQESTPTFPKTIGQEGPSIKSAAP
jgi:hypothetical protein